MLVEKIIRALVKRARVREGRGLTEECAVFVTCFLVYGCGDFGSNVNIVERETVDDNKEGQARHMSMINQKR